MRMTIDTELKTLLVEDGPDEGTYDLYSKVSFEILSKQWIKVGWVEKYPYTFSWFGRPIIQLPEDLIRIQEVIYSLKPDVIIETGVAHGGSLVFYASLCKAMNKGRVIGIDIEIRKPNRAAIEKHELSEYIQLVEGSSTAPEIVSYVKQQVKPHETVLVILDSNHSRQHVTDELHAYADLVTPGSYIVATDGVMMDLHDAPRGKPEWAQDNPSMAAVDFATQSSDFEIVQPEWPFNESKLSDNVTHWPMAYLRKKVPSGTVSHSVS